MSRDSILLFQSHSLSELRTNWHHHCNSTLCFDKVCNLVWPVTTDYMTVIQCYLQSQKELSSSYYKKPLRVKHGRHLATAAWWRTVEEGCWQRSVLCCFLFSVVFAVIMFCELLLQTPSHLPFIDWWWVCFVVFADGWSLAVCVN